MAPYSKLRFSSFFLAALLGTTGLVAGCRTTPTQPGDISDAAALGPDGQFDYPAPRTDLVPKAGSDRTFEIATWNIENFPKRTSTVSTVADIISSLDLDMIALQEVEDIDAFNELVERLRGYEGILSTHTYGNGAYQKVGFLYKSDLVTISDPFLLFTQDGYEFPRPALKIDVEVKAGETEFDFTAIALHLKAGGGAENQSRREAATRILQNHLNTAVSGSGNPAIIVLGDYNATIDRDTDVFANLNDTSKYTIRTRGNYDAGEISFVPSGVLLDHQVTTSAFESQHTGGDTIIPRLDMQINSYVSGVSDHLPVIVRVPL